MQRAFILAGLLVLAPSGLPARDLTLATWNLEWLMEPRVIRQLRASCVSGDRLPRSGARVIPCDVAETKERSRADFAALARYAQRLDADVIAIQEVDGPVPASRLFTRHQFCFSRRTHVQNLGFAIRKGLPFRCDADLHALSLGETVRRGVQLTLNPGTAQEIHLLSVHLKSGCGRSALDSDRAECQSLAQQVPVLERWIDEQAAQGRLFAVLGDFNRDLKRESGPARNPQGRLRSLWAEIDDGDPVGADLTLGADLGSFRNCTVAQNYSGFIDQIVLGQALAARVVPGSLRRVTYENADAATRRLADHCPVAITVRL
jgi:endonuclease/exonuclease/phosphatase family metal-dependent hydrolase